MAHSSPMWVMGCGSLKSSVGLISLWISQVHCGSLKSGGVGWVLNRCGLWWVVMALGLRIMVDRCVDCSGGGVEISSFFWVIMWWLFLMDVAIVGGFWRLNFFFPSVVAISCGCGWWWIW